MDIFVGNLSFDAVEADVKKLFEDFGNVASVVIVMSKEKKKPKSRGFGFVVMPDEQQAQAAIAALNGKEFMARPLNVNISRPKTEAERQNELKQKQFLKAKAKAKKHKPAGIIERKTFVQPFISKPGTYKGGRRTTSYMKKQAQSGVQVEAKPWRKNQDNPMRWRKKKDQLKPWEKPKTESKPWKKTKTKFQGPKKPGNWASKARA